MLPTLPALEPPEAFVGQLLYDFGNHVSLGYTPGEIAILRESPEYTAGAVYQIYRADAGGTVELRGIRDGPWLQKEAMAFSRSEGAAARRDYDLLCRHAQSAPVPAHVELRLVKRYSQELPYVTALAYPAVASEFVARWISAVSFQHAQVKFGPEALAAFLDSGAMRLSSCMLPGWFDYQDRPREEVRAAVQDVFQRRPLPRTIGR